MMEESTPIPFFTTKLYFSQSFKESFCNMTTEKKYTFVNGVMKLNPNYQKPSVGGSNAPVVSSAEQKRTSEALAIVSTTEDIEEAKGSYTSSFVEEENPNEPKINFEYQSQTQTAVDMLQGDAYKNNFGDNSQDLYQGLMDYFVIYEIPIGLLNKLLELRNYRLNFMIDDSGSMMNHSDAAMSEATQHMPCFGGTGVMTRLQEEENRLHIFIDILSFIPTKGMNFFMMNSPQLDFSLEQAGKAPDAFKFEAHAKIRETFENLTMGATPTNRILMKSFADAAQHSSVPTAHFLLTDGVPSDASATAIGRLIKNRVNPLQNPLTLISCTNVDSECEWMKDIEGIAPYCSECDDFRDEQAEVMKDQGKAFPYTRGFWLLSALVGAMNPDDLDALDEDVPLSKFTLDLLLGREHSANEYNYYFENNPHARHYKEKYEQFLNSKCVAAQIVPKNERVRVSRAGGGGDDGCCIVM